MTCLAEINCSSTANTEVVPSYILDSDICIVPHDVSDFINSTIPNKLFDYMACKKPVIASDAAPFKRIFEETDCGLIFKSKDISDFADKVVQLADPVLRKKMGANGFKAIASKYNWEHDSRVLQGIIKNIFVTGPP